MAVMRICLKKAFRQKCLIQQILFQICISFLILTFKIHILLFQKKAMNNTTKKERLGFRILIKILVIFLIQISFIILLKTTLGRIMFMLNISLIVRKKKRHWLIEHTTKSRLGIMRPIISGLVLVIITVIIKI